MDNKRPFAHLLRPESLADYVGQQHLLGTNKPLGKLIENNHTCSMILWGPPGSGKTSLIHLLQKYWNISFIELSAVNSGLKDIKHILDSPEDLLASQRLVFVDEIHRFNKVQQDAFLPYVESGQILLVGATTENPAFSINNALLSRVSVFRLHKLDDDELTLLLSKALSKLNTDYIINASIDDEAIQALISRANGDARKILGDLELLIKPNIKKAISNFTLTLLDLEQSLGFKTARFDKKGDDFYDLLSAFHKSVRGSSCDGALFWFARMLQVSEDVTPICRRLLAIASEDIGNADPRALQICLNAWDIYQRVGTQEGERAIAQAIIYCALAPKSNSVYKAFKAAKQAAQRFPFESVPMHLKNPRKQDNGQTVSHNTYQYSHDYEHAISPNQSYLPDILENANFYQPNPRGLEKQYIEKIQFLEQVTNKRETK